MKRQLLAFLLLASPMSTAIATFGNEAMFGLTWGMTPAEIEAGGTNLTKVTPNGVLEVYSTKSLPKDLSDVESYHLVFTNDRLVKIVVTGKAIRDDLLGTSGKARYEELKTALSAKYGPPSRNFERTGARLYKDADEFYQCLRYAGCGLWSSVYETEDRVMKISIEGASRGEGFIELAVESVPEFSEALDRAKEGKRRSDSDAL